MFLKERLFVTIIMCVLMIMVGTTVVDSMHAKPNPVSLTTHIVLIKFQQYIRKFHLSWITYSKPAETKAHL